MDVVIPEANVDGKRLAVPDGHDLYYIKLIGIGPTTLAGSDGIASKVVDGVSGYYFIGLTDEIEEKLISIVRRCFADRRQQKEDNGTA